MPITPKTEIRREIRRLVALQRTVTTNYGAGCCLIATQALRWALEGDAKSPPPTAFVEIADLGAQQRRK